MDIDRTEPSWEGIANVKVKSFVELILDNFVEVSLSFFCFLMELAREDESHPAITPS